VPSHQHREACQSCSVTARLGGGGGSCEKATSSGCTRWTEEDSEEEKHDGEGMGRRGRGTKAATAKSEQFLWNDDNRWTQYVSTYAVYRKWLQLWSFQWHCCIWFFHYMLFLFWVCFLLYVCCFGKINKEINNNNNNMEHECWLRRSSRSVVRNTLILLSH